MGTEMVEGKRGAAVNVVVHVDDEALCDPRYYASPTMHQMILDQYYTVKVLESLLNLWNHKKFQTVCPQSAGQPHWQPFSAPHRQCSRGSAA